MQKHSKTILAVVAVAIVLSLGIAAFVPSGNVYAASLDRRGTSGSWGGRGQGGAAAPGAGYALTPLSDAEAQALQNAILEEYGALNLYSAVIDQFGSVYPFTQVAQSEQQHVNALVRQAEKYGLTVPANPGLTDAPAFADLTAACQAGVAAEIADAALYDDLKLVTTHADLTQVYDSLQNASLNSHLPIFQTCD